MLPNDARVRSAAEFSDVVRFGRRAGRPTLVVHLDVRPGPSRETSGARAGFVVSKGVGGSVVRHRVTRRLRHQTRELLGMLPPGSRLVVRALPSAATASSAQLAADLRSGLARVGVAT